MAYELLFSRVIDSDRRTLFTDVPIVASSIMVEITALSADVRRLAGWLYPVIYSSPQEYERQDGSVIIFGRSRVNMPSVPRDLFLEFFPQYGLKGFVISVFSGFPGPPPPPPPAIKIPGSEVWIYRSLLDGFLMYSQSRMGPFDRVPGWSSCSQACVRANGQVWLDLGYPQYAFAWSVPGPLNSANEGNWVGVVGEPGSVLIPSG